MTENSHPQPTAEQRKSLLQDGFILIKQAVPQAIVAQAHDLIRDALPKNERRLLVPGELATHPKVIGLFYDSQIAPLLRQLMGPFPPVISSQVAVTPPRDDLGGTPGTHVDGGWSGEIPTTAEEIDPATHRPIDAARYFGANDEKRGTNDGLLWIDPERRISTGSYTALVGVCLSDQRTPGHGQFGVLKGLHEQVEAAFCRQRDTGSIIGAEGLDWPRVKIDAQGRPYMNGLPDSIRREAANMAKTNKPINGWPWKELTPILMEPGDAIIAMHSL